MARLGYAPDGYLHDPQKGAFMFRHIPSRWRRAGVISLLAALYLLPRMAGIDAGVTTDEPFWLGRSANFYDALWHNRLADTFQHAHPGVTTMWAGMVGYWIAAPSYVDVYDTNLGTVYRIHERIRAMGLSETEVLETARAVKVVLQTALFAVAMLLLWRLTSRGVTVIAGVIIALNPFLIAHDRLLHVDGLFAISSCAAVLAIADATILGGRRLMPWAVAGALAGLAWLTRSTGIMLIAVAGGALLVDALRTGHAGLPSRILRRASLFGAWLGSAVAVTVVLWPAVWAAPERTLSFMYRWLTGAAANGHELPTYFMGTIHTGDPGALFYPVTILWRLSVVTSIGLILLVAILASGRLQSCIHPRTRHAVTICLAFAALFVLGMTFGAKKFDRYVLPVYPVLDVVAAVGIAAAVRWVATRREALARRLAPAMLASLLVLQVLVTFSARPYYLDAYNPLLGGTTAAEDVMQLGWGEGVSEVADFVIADTGVQPGDTVENPPVLRISGGSAPLIYALPPPFLVEPSAFLTAGDWRSTRYYVATIQQWQRDISGDVIDYVKQYEPVYSVSIHGVQAVRVYDLRDIPPPPWLTGDASCQWRFDEWLRLVNVVPDGNTVTLWFRTLSPRDLPHEITITVGLVSLDGNLETSPAERWSATLEPMRERHWHAPVSLEIHPPDGSELDQWLLTITATDAATGEQIAAIPPGSESAQQAAYVLPDCGA